MTNCKLVRSLCLDIGLVNFWRVYELRLHLIPNTCILTLPEKLYFLISSSFRNPRGSKNSQSYDTHFADIDSSSGFARIVCYLPRKHSPTACGNIIYPREKNILGSKFGVGILDVAYSG